MTAGKGGTVSVTVLFCGDGEREGVQEDNTRDEVNFEPIFVIILKNSCSHCKFQNYSIFRKIQRLPGLSV